MKYLKLVTISNLRVKMAKNRIICKQSRTFDAYSTNSNAVQIGKSTGWKQIFHLGLPFIFLKLLELLNA